MIYLSFVFKENHVLIEEEESPSDNVFIVEEDDIRYQHDIDGIYIDGIENLVDLPRITFLDEECVNFKAAFDGRVLTRNNDRKKTPSFRSLQMSTLWQML